MGLTLEEINALKGEKVIEVPVEPPAPSPQPVEEVEQPAKEPTPLTPKQKKIKMQVRSWQEFKNSYRMLSLDIKFFNWLIDRFTLALIRYAKMRKWTYSKYRRKAVDKAAGAGCSGCSRKIAGEQQ